MKLGHLSSTIRRLFLLTSAHSVSQGTAAVSLDPSFAAFLPQVEQADHRFINGDPSARLAQVSRREDATIFGGWGAYEKGWSQVGPRYQWAASRFLESGAKVQVEYLSSGVSGELAYTVHIERAEVRLIDQSKVAPIALRVTHIFRKEDGSWKLIHRHADPLREKMAPASVIQK